jgi:hypothetical protein
MECYECCSPRIIGYIEISGDSYIFLCKPCMNKYTSSVEEKPTEPTYEPVATLTPLQALEKLKKPNATKKRIVFHWRGKHE